MALFKEKAKKLLADMRTSRNRGTCTFVSADKTEEESQFIAHVKSVLEGQPGTSNSGHHPSLPSSSSSDSIDSKNRLHDQDFNNNESTNRQNQDDCSPAEKFRQLALQVRQHHQQQQRQVEQKDSEEQQAVYDDDPEVAIAEFKTKWDSSYNHIQQQQKSLSDFLILKTLGKGAFGRVLLVQYRNTGQFYAMKVIEKEAVIIRDNVEGILNEKRTLQSVNHPFLVQLQMHFQDSTNLYMIMEFVGGGDLFFHLKKKHRFTEKEAQFYGGQIVLALEYLHCLNIVYRDLKPENILITNDGYIKTIVNIIAVTAEYMCPEILLQRPYGKSVDYWAFGIILFEMVHGESPFRSNSDTETYEKILHGRIKFQGQLSGLLKHLITNLLKDDPVERYGNSVNDVKSHPWFGSINWIALLNKRVDPPFIPKLVHRGDSRFFEKFDEKFADTLSETPDSHPDVYKDIFKDF